MSEEVYENISAKEMAKILREKIESRQLFRVKFVSEIPIFISISYYVGTRKFTLTVDRSITNKLVDKEEIDIRIPDEFVEGYGLMSVTGLGISFGVHGYGREVKIIREKVTPRSNYTSLYIQGG
jgi:hypothetical protein